ncbi:Retrovirus-related Pol polyprotein from transposon 412 [Eumeta japonica]|uniref:Retrovirus-related Pol polyprotein from transposon 412 n=1 Tax=Eumeta variegata TaxID=151549 RepID=A0A4C1SRC9_EUMVA|nr:Retrovirus-related Pol polyprotein from transposon 412 [Eumeta japonica]
MCPPNKYQQERIRMLKNIIMTEINWNTEEIESMNRMCENYHDVFMLDGDALPFTTLVKHRIPKNRANPINQRQYRLPHVHKEEINRQVSELLKEGIISPSAQKNFKTAKTSGQIVGLTSEN